jgi:hypothetical protein
MLVRKGFRIGHFCTIKLYRVIRFYAHPYSVKWKGLILLMNHVENPADERRHILIDKERN